MADADAIHYQVASEIFGWKWMSWDGTPVRGTPNYPMQCRVRAFTSPETMKDAHWLARMSGKALQEANGSEPLSYAHCSSMGPEWVPHFDGAEDYLVLQYVRKKWSRAKLELFSSALAGIWGGRGESQGKSWMAWVLYELGDYSRAAIIAQSSRRPSRST